MVRSYVCQPGTDQLTLAETGKSKHLRQLSVFAFMLESQCLRSVVSYGHCYCPEHVLCSRPARPSLSPPCVETVLGSISWRSSYTCRYGSSTAWLLPRPSGHVQQSLLSNAASLNNHHTDSRPAGNLFLSRFAFEQVSTSWVARISPADQMDWASLTHSPSRMCPCDI